MGLSVGEQLGRYRITKWLGAGGMGEVYRARDPSLDRDVAVKLLSARVESDEEALARFEREARAAAALQHPNVVLVLDVGRHETRPFIVTELLEGQTVRERLESGPLPAADAQRLAAQLADGLAAAHARGIVHRDLKPENLFLTDGDRLKILDFGVAKLDAAPGGALGSSPAALHTRTGSVLGTVPYMSPEQVRGEAVDTRSDLFSLGTILHELLTGDLPFSGASAVELGFAILSDPPAPLPPSTPPILADLVRRCLEKAPSGRPTAASVRDLLARPETAPMPPTTTRSGGVRLRWAAALAALAAMAIAAVVGLRSERAPSSIPTEPATLVLEELPAGPDIAVAEAFRILLRTELSDGTPLAIVPRGEPARWSLSGRWATVGSEGDAGPAAISVELELREGGHEVAAASVTLTGRTSELPELAARGAAQLRPALGLPARPPRTQSPMPSKEAEEAYARAKTLLLDFELTALTRLMEPTLAREPDFARGHAILAYTFTSSGDWDKALREQVIARTLARGLPREEVMLIEALCHATNDGDGDIARFQTLYALAPRDPMLIVLLASAYSDRGRNEDALRTIENGQALGAEGYPGFDIIAGKNLARLGESKAGLQRLEKAAEASRASGRRQLVAMALEGLAGFYGSGSDAVAALLEARDLYREGEHPVGELTTMAALAGVRIVLGDLEGAAAGYRECVERAKQSSLRRLKGASYPAQECLCSLAVVNTMAGQPELALRTLAEVPSVWRTFASKYPNETGHPLRYGAIVRLGRPEETARELAAMLEAAPKGSPVDQGIALLGTGRLLFAEPSASAARTRLEKALRLQGKLALWRPLVQLAVARIDLVDGDPRRAVELARAAADSWNRSGAPGYEAFARAALAEGLVASQQAKSAEAEAARAEKLAAVSSWRGEKLAALRARVIVDVALRRAADLEDHVARLEAFAAEARKDGCVDEELTAAIEAAGLRRRLGRAGSPALGELATLARERGYVDLARRAETLAR